MPRKKISTNDPSTEPEVTSSTLEKQSRAKPRAKAAAVKPETADSELAPTFRRPKSTVAPAAEPAKTATRRKPAGKAEALDSDDLPTLTWRSASAAPATSDEVVKKADRSRRDRGAKPEPKRAEALPEFESIGTVEDFGDDEVPMTLVFRKAAEEARSTVAPERGRRTRSERGEGKAAIDQPVQSAAPPVSAPPKPLIPIPEAAPQIVMRDGIPTLVRNLRVYPPIMFFGSATDKRRSETVFDELRMAAEAGIHIHSHLIEFTVDGRQLEDHVRVAQFLLSQTITIDPQAQVVLRLVIEAPRGWEARYPAGILPDSGQADGQPSISDNAFWGDTESLLRDFVVRLRELREADHILGIHLDRGEWFYSSNSAYDNSPAAVEGFREWSRHRYGNDIVALRANWFDGSATFEGLMPPRYEPVSADGERFVRSSRKQRRHVDFHLFLADAMVQRIGEMAYAIKEASEGFFLVGCSYGYTFEWSHPASGHLSLGKLLRTPEIDFIAGPPSYRNREPGGTAPFPGPIDSFALNGKLYISEEDYKTSLSAGQEPDDFNPALKTPQALESVHWRGAGAALAHGSGVNWMDLWGNGWLKTASVWDRAEKLQRTMIQRMGAPLGDPDVVVFIDERALAYLVDDHAFQLLVQNTRESVLRAGVSAGFYLLSDLAHRERFPEAKLYIFLNAWDIRPDLRDAIKTRLQRDDKVLFWLYSAGLFDAGRDSLERAREVTGIALKPQPFHSKSGTTILNRRHPLAEAFPGAIVGSQQLEPSYFAIPEDALVLGEYSQTGLPSFVIKDFRPQAADEPAWTSVFLGEPLVNAALIRVLATMAGAHVYSFADDVVHVREPFLTVHCGGAGMRTIALPKGWAAFNLLANSWMQLEATSLRFQALDGSTHVFLVGTRDYIESLLAMRPEDLLTMTELPPRDLNVRQDGMAFDVPIMRLDEWIEGGEPDEVADEWFLRPHAILESIEDSVPASSEKVGRRRRRRRGGRGGSDEISSSRPEPSGSPFAAREDLSVMFRKRD